MASQADTEAVFARIAFAYEVSGMRERLGIQLHSCLAGSWRLPAQEAQHSRCSRLRNAQYVRESEADGEAMTSPESCHKTTRLQAVEGSLFGRLRTVALLINQAVLLKRLS